MRYLLITVFSLALLTSCTSEEAADQSEQEQADQGQLTPPAQEDPMQKLLGASSPDDLGVQLLNSLKTNYLEKLQNLILTEEKQNAMIALGATDTPSSDTDVMRKSDEEIIKEIEGQFSQVIEKGRAAGIDWTNAQIAGPVNMNLQPEQELIVAQMSIPVNSGGKPYILQTKAADWRGHWYLLGGLDIREGSAQ